ncbi:ESAT-6 like protein EsxD [Mycobacterium lentiflavum]|uniref:ESAT-6 like protein EsxD n=1 Tax=Mycobacterium lentiflavum TaxID=141349 RepID=A0A0E3WAX4_MYCLN|nr:WXG100 family type VII secretion target [Mycobacterium lentiflavum]MEE3063581.1 WXG100 family type VII secretion target [Actinomycetota bacterium]ULP42437.1 WXG100 family type VII secretion target [Mycobacterium lentiflavum]CQD02558.1 ESAT-6 like protein EsxD [Mycobacterium lentiflavum]
MPSSTVVTPDLLRASQQKIESRLQEAAAIANQYLSGHENVVSAAGWTGQAGTTSLNTAGQIQHDLQQIMTGGNRLAHGLGKTATLMEHHEADSAHNLNGVFGGAQSA